MGELCCFPQERPPTHAQADSRAETTWVIGAPPCTSFTALHHTINYAKMPADEGKRSMDKGMLHLRFACKLYRDQLRQGIYVLHGHPRTAKSWDSEPAQQTLKDPCVRVTKCDQCMYGCKAFDGSPVQKPTQFLTNAPELAKRLRVRCSGRGGECSRPDGGVHAHGPQSCRLRFQTLQGDTHGVPGPTSSGRAL